MTSKKGYSRDTENRIATLEANHAELYKSVEEIKTNHLAHLSQDVAEVKDGINNLRVTMAKWTGGLAVAVTLVQLLLKYAKPQ